MKVSHRIIRLATLSLAILALAAPVAGAVPARSDLTPAEQVVIEPAPAPVVQSVETGIDWASAAIGAGIAGGMHPAHRVGRHQVPPPP